MNFLAWAAFSYFSVLFADVKIGEATLYRFKVNAHNYYVLGVHARAAFS